MIESESRSSPYPRFKQWRPWKVFGLAFFLWLGAGVLWYGTQSRIKADFINDDDTPPTVTVKWRLTKSGKETRDEREIKGRLRFWLPRSEAAMFYIRPRPELGKEEEEVEQREFTIERFEVRQFGFETYDALADKPLATRDVESVGDNRWKITGPAPRLRYRTAFRAKEYSSNRFARQMLPWALWGLLAGALAVVGSFLPWRKINVETLFGIDRRALATLRIGLATVILFDLGTRARSLTAHYTDHGIMPISGWLDYFAPGGESKGLFWSLHLFNGQTWGQVLIFSMAAVFAVMMLVGYRTRLATFLCWLLLTSLHTRIPFVCQGGDVMLRMLLFWGMFLPLGVCWSVDRRRGIGSTPPSNYVLSFGTAAIFIQIVYIYIGTAVSKSSPEWTVDFTAVHHALHSENYTTPIGIWFRQFAGLFPALTIGTLLLEYVGPIVAFSPWWTKPVRIIVVFSFWVFHLSTQLMMELGPFPWIAYVAWTMFLPDTFWDWLQRRRAANWLARPFRFLFKAGDAILPRAPAVAKEADPGGRKAKRIRGWVVNGAIVFLLAYLLLWNVREINRQSWLAKRFSRDYHGLAHLLRIDQSWSMFSGTIPHTGWYVMKGTLRNGEVVDLWQLSETVSTEKPLLVSEFYKTQRWRKYLMNLTGDRFKHLLGPFSDWLRWRWDTHCAKGDPDREVWKVEIDYHMQKTPPPGVAKEALEIRRLWTWSHPPEENEEEEGGSPSEALDG